MVVAAPGLLPPLFPVYHNLPDAHLVRPCFRSLSPSPLLSSSQGFEQVKALYLESPSHQFSVDNNLLTPTFKLKRPQLQVGGGSEWVGEGGREGGARGCGAWGAVWESRWE